MRASFRRFPVYESIGAIGIAAIVLMPSTVWTNIAAGAKGILFPLIGSAVAAFCIWLTVRLANRRERWSKRAAVKLISLLLLVGYPLSVGPAFWLSQHLEIDHRLWGVYAPLVWGVESGPEIIAELFTTYLGLWGDLRCC